MKSTVKNGKKSTVIVKVEMTAEELVPHRAKAIEEISKSVKVSGFRPGHVPEDKLIEKVGEAVVIQEATNLAVRAGYIAAVNEHKIRVVAPPQIEVESADPIRFTATVAVLPEVDLGKWQKIKLKKAEVKVDKKEIEEQIAQIQKNFAEPVEVERAAKDGDRVEIDFEGFAEGGVPLDGTKSKNHPFTIGEGNFIPGFEDGIIGLKKDEEKEHEVTFPEDYHASHLAGKPVKFKFKMHRVLELKKPELDDEFAKKLRGGDSKWSDIEKDVNDGLTEKKTKEANEKTQNELIEELLKTAKVELPDAMIEEEISHMLVEFKQRLSQGGLSWEDYLKNSKKTEEDVRKEAAEEAEKRIKVRLVVNELIEQEKPEITDTELIAEIEKIKKSAPPAELKKIEDFYKLGTPGAERLRHQLKVLKLTNDLVTRLSK